MTYIHHFHRFYFLFSFPYKVSQWQISLLPPLTPTLQTLTGILFLSLRHTCLAPLVSQSGMLLGFLLSLCLSTLYFPELNLLRNVRNLLIHFSAPGSCSLEETFLRLYPKSSQLAKWTHSHSIKSSETRKNTGKYCRSQGPS